ncbi:MAG TPA: hypothetical protein VF074_09700 [Pyrinomonadaceae bacterium]
MRSTTHSPLLEPDVRISRIRLSRQTYQAVARLSGILQAQAFEVSVVATERTRSEAVQHLYVD